MTSWYSLPIARDWTCLSSPGEAYAFHQSLPGYSPTPLVPVPELAAELGVGQLLVKDESSRMGLSAFKVLGASWACRQVLLRRPGAMLVTATDGNHGRAVARMASLFGVAATVFVPVVMLPETAARIAAEGAQVVWVDGGYDNAVRWAAAFAADQPGRALVQDTAWAGYELSGRGGGTALPAPRCRSSERALGRTRYRGMRPGEPDGCACHHGADRGDGDGRAQLRHCLQLRVASVARRLRRGCRRQ